ncbi:Protein NRT1/ PTR FAMILY 6 [Arachis hypogaea]|nr:Protein NRT1/ PTR FAMILY 6 [Arachis hypogaea]
MADGKKHISTPVPHDSYSVLSVSSSGKYVDQFDETDPKESRLMSTFFNTLLQSCLQCALGFGIGTIAMLLGIIIFAAALPLYRIHPAKGTSALLEIVQVYVAAIRNRRLTLPEDPAELYVIEQDREATLETEFLPHRDIYSLKYGLNILQGIEGENKNSKKSLKVI